MNAKQNEADASGVIHRPRRNGAALGRVEKVVNAHDDDANTGQQTDGGNESMPTLSGKKRRRMRSLFLVAVAAV